MEPYITAGAELLINAGQSDQETVTVSAVTTTTFTAEFTKTHPADFTIGDVTTSAAAITTTGQQVVVTPAIMQPYIAVGAELSINVGKSDQEVVTVSAVTPTTFTAEFTKAHAANFTISGGSPNSVAPISAGSLTITASQIGSTADVIQTSATTINATADYGGIYLSNNNSGTVTLTAAAVGTASGATANNVEIYSEGNINLSPQTTTLTKLATKLPVAVFSPGGNLRLFAGGTLSADGDTSTVDNSSATVTDMPPPSGSYDDIYTGNYNIDGAIVTDDFSSSNNGGLDSNWIVQSGSFLVAGQTAMGYGSGTNLATLSGVNESVSATDQRHFGERRNRGPGGSLYGPRHVLLRLHRGRPSRVHGLDL